MASGLSALFGLGLIVLSFAGWRVGATPWITWVALAAGGAALVIAVELARASERRAGSRAAALSGLGILLLIVGGVGTVTGATAALVWGTLVFAVAFLVVGIGLTYGVFPRFPIGAALPYDEQFGSSHRFLYHPSSSYRGNRIALGEFSGRGPRHYRRDDSRIREEICEQLTLHGEIDASEMSVEVKEGIVLLSGEVTSRRARRLVEEVVEATVGVKNLRNDLRLGGSDRGESPPFRAA